MASVRDTKQAASSVEDVMPLRPVSKKPQVANDYANDFSYGTSVATCEPNIRLGFIRKVYGILAVQLAITTAICTLFMLVTPLRNLAIAGYGVITIASTIGTFGTLLALMVYKDSHPVNMQLLAGFTVCESLLMAMVCARYAQSGLSVLVVEALVITLAIFSGITLYAFTSKKDFSFMGGALYAALMGLLIAMIVNMFLGFTGNKSPFMAMLISYGGSLLFSLYILYDSKLLFNLRLRIRFSVAHFSRNDD